MNTRIAAGIMMALAAVACDRPGKSDKGMGAGADTIGLRDTTVATPAPAPAPVPNSDSLRERTSKITGDTVTGATKTTPKNQTQSGMKNKTGQSTLGPGVKRTRPDANEPVTAKGDTLSSDATGGSRSAGQRATDSLNAAALQRANEATQGGGNPVPSDSQKIQGNDTMPQPTPVPVPTPAPTDSTKPVPADSMKPMPMPMPTPADSMKPIPTDSTKAPPPLPLDTMPRPIKDSTHKDSVKH